MIIEIPLALLFEWVDRKITARIQRRIGPKYTGPFGILQPLADLIKLLQKETYEVKSKENIIIPFLLISSLSITLFLFLFLPFPYPVFSFKGDVILILFLYSLVVLFFIMIGYVIPSPFSNIGSGRLLQLFVSFELLFIISVSTVIMLSGKITLREIWNQNVPFVLFLPLSFAGYIISSSAKLSFTPFDIPDAKTEIAGGWKCELSGRDLAIVRLCYDLELLFLSSFGTLLYLGYYNFLDFLLKSLFFLIILVIAKNSASRLRVDQAIELFWKAAIPLSLLQFILIGVML